jgi:formate-dependent phosphoribosylglycinamide formyltransferase (GAR transformylase)
MRLLLLTTTTGYQTRQFTEAALKAGAEVVLGSDRCHRLDDPWRDGALALPFGEPEEAARRIVEYAQAAPLQGIVALGDCTPPAAARACRKLALPFHSPESADVCRDKHRSRRRLARAGLGVPDFICYPLGDDPLAIAPSGSPPCGFPCVLKPLALSASRGVIRADGPEEFTAAFERIRKLLRSPEVRVMRQPTSDFIQVEKYIEGEEFAVEAVMDRGRLRILAVFDKPDPLTGPYFAEGIYVTPSRQAPETLSRLTESVARAAGALGLSHGPLHAEVRINPQGVWFLEVAARPIGGLCSRALRFTSSNLPGRLSLEELIVRLATGEEIEPLERERAASGVMMIPVAEEGILEGVEGLEQARAVPGVEEIILTARPPQKLVPWPEGSSYPGFIFARGESPEVVVRALRAAHRKLRFVLSPALPVL